MENPQQDGNPHGRQDTNESANKIATPSGSEELGPTSHDVAIGILNNFNTSDHQSRDYEPSRPVTRPTTRPNSAQRLQKRPPSPSTRPGSSKRPTSPATRVDIQKINTANLNRNRSGTMESIASEADTSQLINLLDEFLSNSPSNKAAKNGVLSPSKMKMDFDSGKNEEELQPETLKHIERFTMLLVKALQGFGCPTHMLDFHAGEVAKGLGHPASFAIFPSFIIATFAHKLQNHGDANYEILRNPPECQTIFVHTSPGLNVYKLQLIKELCKRVSNYKKDGKGIEVGMMGSVASLAQRNSIVQGMSITVRPPTLLEGLQKKRPTLQNASGLRMSLLPEDDEEKLLSGSILVKEPSLLSIPTIEDRIDQDNDESDEYEQDKITQLKQYILQLAHDGPSVYHALSRHADSVRQANLPEEEHEKMEKHLKRFRNAFAVIAVEDATSKLEEILALPPLYPFWTQICIAGISSGGVSGLFFAGGWDDVFVGGFLGAVIAGVGRVVQKPFDKTFEFLAAVVVSAIVRVLIYTGLPLCYASTTISAVLPLLQGTAITMAMVELATRNMVPGTTRLFAGLTMTTLIGFGLEFGLEVVSGILRIQKRPGDISNPNSDSAFIPNDCAPLDIRWHWLLFPVTAVAQALNMNAHYKQLPGMLAASAIAYIVRNHLGRSLNNQIAIALSAFCCGCFSNIYGRLRGVPAMVPTYAGMLMLVPGSMALRSVTELLGSDPTKGVSLVMSVLSISLSIGLGLFLSATIIVPIHDWADQVKGKHRRVDDLENLSF